MSGLPGHAAGQRLAAFAERDRLLPSSPLKRWFSDPRCILIDLALATGKTRQELYAACPGDRPNHVGIAVQRHIRAGRIQEREGRLYAIVTVAE